jgi:hypothetical protein
MAGVRDPFGPPDQQEDSGLELAVNAPAPRAPAATPLPVPVPRAKVVYSKPSGGAANLLLWTFASLGGVAVAGGGVWWWRGHATDAAKEAAAKPVVWHSLVSSDEVLVTVEVLPKSAPRTRLLVDGDPARSNPMLLRLGSTHKIAALAEGFDPAELQVTADGPKTVRLRLAHAR